VQGGGGGKGHTVWAHIVENVFQIKKITHIPISHNKYSISFYNPPRPSCYMEQTNIEFTNEY